MCRFRVKLINLWLTLKCSEKRPKKLLTTFNDASKTSKGKQRDLEYVEKIFDGLKQLIENKKKEVLTEIAEEYEQFLQRTKAGATTADRVIRELHTFNGKLEMMEEDLAVSENYEYLKQRMDLLREEFRLNKERFEELRMANKKAQKDARKDVKIANQKELEEYITISIEGAFKLRDGVRRPTKLTEYMNTEPAQRMPIIRNDCEKHQDSSLNSSSPIGRRQFRNPVVKNVIRGESRDRVRKSSLLKHTSPTIPRNVKREDASGPLRRAGSHIRAKSSLSKLNKTCDNTSVGGGGKYQDNPQDRTSTVTTSSSSRNDQQRRESKLTVTTSPDGEKSSRNSIFSHLVLESSPSLNRAYSQSPQRPYRNIHKVEERLKKIQSVYNRFDTEHVHGDDNSTEADPNELKLFSSETKDEISSIGARSSSPGVHSQILSLNRAKTMILEREHPKLFFLELNSQNLYIYDIYIKAWHKYVLEIDFAFDHDSRSVFTPDGKLYITGGLRENAHVNEVYMFDTSNPKCGRHGGYKLRELKPMFTGRSSHALVYCQGKLYALGGSTHQHEKDNRCEVYDIAHNTWFRLSPMNYGRFYHSACNWDDESIFIFGGWAKSLDHITDAQQVVEKYDISANRWWRVKVRAWHDPSKEHRYFGGAIPWNGGDDLSTIQYSDTQILLFGGRHAKSRSLTSDNFLFDVNTYEIRKLNIELSGSSSFIGGAYKFRESEVDSEKRYQADNDEFLIYSMDEMRNVNCFNSRTRQWEIV